MGERRLEMRLKSGEGPVSRGREGSEEGKGTGCRGEEERALHFLCGGVICGWRRGK